MVFIVSTLVTFSPNLLTSFAAQLVQAAAATAKEAQLRSRSNNFLDRVNREVFMPRGLFAMVMSFKDDVPSNKNMVRKVTGAFGQIMLTMPEKVDVRSERLGPEEAAAKYSKPDTELSSTQKKMRGLRLASGETYPHVQLPDAAPLVYPDLDRLVARAAEGKSNAQASMIHAGAWVGDYMDRRSHFLFVSFSLPLFFLLIIYFSTANSNQEQSHPDQKALVVPESERKAFVSRYNDPNHKANSGSLTAVLTGGRFGHHSLADRFVMVQDAIKKSRNGGVLPDPERVRGARRAKLKKKKNAFLKRNFVQDVLYLMVVNLPGDDEMQKLENILQQAEQELPPGVMAPPGISEQPSH